MSNSGSNIKLLCEEYINSTYNDEQTVKVLNKILR